MKLPRTPLAKRRLTDTVSSTGKFRMADEAKACTATISPHNARRFPISCTMLISSGPPPSCRRHGPSSKYWSGLQNSSYAVFCLKKKNAVDHRPDLTGRPDTPQGADVELYQQGGVT